MEASLKQLEHEKTARGYEYEDVILKLTNSEQQSGKTLERLQKEKGWLEKDLAGAMEQISALRDEMEEEKLKYVAALKRLAVNPSDVDESIRDLMGGVQDGEITDILQTPLRKNNRETGQNAVSSEENKINTLVRSVQKSALSSGKNLTSVHSGPKSTRTHGGGWKRPMNSRPIGRNVFSPNSSGGNVIGRNSSSSGDSCNISNGAKGGGNSSAINPVLKWQFLARDRALFRHTKDVIGKAFKLAIIKQNEHLKVYFERWARVLRPAGFSAGKSHRRASQWM